MLTNESIVKVGETVAFLTPTPIRLHSNAVVPANSKLSGAGGVRESQANSKLSRAGGVRGSPPTTDKLFWCFFIILKGEHEYEIDNSFKREKEFKIECIEKLRSIKSELKALKLRLNAIENDLLNENKISIKSLVALCLLYKKNVLYVWNRKYFEIINNPEETINIIINENGEDTISNDTSATKINYYKDNYWLIENIEKPLKAMTGYTKDELFIITQKLDIKDVTIKSTKKAMYEKILEKL